MVGPIGVVGGNPSGPNQSQPLGVFTPAPAQQVISPQCPSPPQNAPIGLVSFPALQVNPPPPNEPTPNPCVVCENPGSGSGSFSGSLIDLTGTSGGAVVFETKVAGDTSERFTITADGTMSWGSGTGATDVSLARSGVGVLTLSGSIVVTGSVTVPALAPGEIAFGSPTSTIIGSPSLTWDNANLICKLTGTVATPPEVRLVTGATTQVSQVSFYNSLNVLSGFVQFRDSAAPTDVNALELGTRIAGGILAFKIESNNEAARFKMNTNFPGLLINATAFTSPEQQVYAAVTGNFAAKFTQESLTDGTLSHSGFQADAPGSSMEVGATAMSWTPSAGIQAKTAFLRGHTCDLAIISDGAGKNINFITGAVGSQTQVGQVKSNGDWLIEPRGSAGANAPAEFRLQNTLNGTASYMALNIDSSGSSVYLAALATAYTTAGVLVAQTVVLNASGPALSISCTGASSQLRFWTGVGPTQNALLDSTGSFQLISTGSVAFSSGASGAASDLLAVRDAANIWGQRNGGNAQEFNLYNTWTSATNFESLRLSWKESAGEAFFGTVKGSGGGSSRQLHFMTNETDAFTISTSQILYPSGTLATTMTKFFINMPGAAGPPTGVPATTTGYPFYYDQANKKFFIYDGGWKKGQVAGVDVVYA